MSTELKGMIAARALALGLDALGVSKPDAIGPAGQRLAQFLALGRHGDMDWMERNAQRRSHPTALWPDTRSIIMLGLSYAPARDPLAGLAMRSHGAISCYAAGKDYHDVLKGRLKQLAAWLATETGTEVKVLVDTAPLMEKPLAAASGLGWQGKHTNLVSRRHGSWLFLGAILTTAEIAPDTPEPDHCGRCRRCLDVCPTDAFPTPCQLDARRCIAYLTIEHKGHIPRALRPAIANRVFGCDDCLAVCPWNKFARTSRETRFAARAETDTPPLAELLVLDDAAFRMRFAGTPIKRTGRDRFVRNCLIAAGNSGDPGMLALVADRLGDASPLVRAMSVWALHRLADAATASHYRDRYLPHETDAGVRAEWLIGETS